MRCAAVPVVVMASAVLSSTAGLADQVHRTISVSGQGTATAPPDMATIHTGVVTQAETANDALQANNEAMERIMSALKEHKIASKDVQTSSFNVQPDYQRDPQGRTVPKIIGYRVTNQARVRVRNLSDLGQVLDSLVGAGSNQLSGIAFGIDEPAGVLNQARSRAVADARSRAEVYAQAAGVKVGRVLSISESSASPPQPQYLARAEAMGAVPVATGEQELQVSVQIVYSLEDRG